MNACQAKFFCRGKRPFVLWATRRTGRNNTTRILVGPIIGSCPWDKHSPVMKTWKFFSQEVRRHKRYSSHDSARTKISKRQHDRFLFMIRRAMEFQYSSPVARIGERRLSSGALVGLVSPMLQTEKCGSRIGRVGKRWYAVLFIPNWPHDLTQSKASDTTVRGTGCCSRPNRSAMRDFAHRDRYTRPTGLRSKDKAVAFRYGGGHWHCPSCGQGFAFSAHHSRWVCGRCPHCVQRHNQTSRS